MSAGESGGSAMRMAESYGGGTGGASAHVAAAILRRLPGGRVAAPGATTITLEALDPAGAAPAVIAPGTALEAGAGPAAALAPAPAPGFAGFLDGIQRSIVIGHLDGTVPVVHGTIGAVVRVRRGRALTTWGAGATVTRALYLPLARLTTEARRSWDEAGVALVDTHDDGDSPHPHARLAAARLAIQRARETAEAGLADAWCQSATGPLYVDGGVSGFAAAAASPLVVGVIKSHRTLYVDAAEVPALAALAVGARSAAFAVDTRRRARVASWYLRLREGDGADPLSGLVRVEIAAQSFTRARADEVSTWVLAEREPIALPDSRWRVMAYGIRDCEEYLRAVAG